MPQATNADSPTRRALLDNVTEDRFRERTTIAPLFGAKLM
jgi:hypothetical protein